MRDVLTFLEANQGALSLVFAAVVTIATVAYALLTRTLVRETMRLREAETEPELSVYLVPNEHSLMLVDMIIRNIGRGAAHKISWRIDLPEDEAADRGIDFAKLRLFKGMNYLAPGEVIRFFYGECTKLLKDPPMSPYTIHAEYSNARGLPVSQSFTLDVEELRGLSMVGRPPLQDMAKTLEKLEKGVKALAGTVSSGRIRVETMTHTEHTEQQEEWRRRAEAEHIRRRGRQPPGGA